jgi:hypothetical protein
MPIHHNQKILFVSGTTWRRAVLSRGSVPNWSRTAKSGRKAMFSSVFVPPHADCGMASMERQTQTKG